MSEHFPNEVSAKELEEPQLGGGELADNSPPLVLVLPESARIPEGATFYEGEDDGTCRVVKADGSRCLGIRLKAYGLCAGHAGTSRILDDPRGMQRKAATAKLRARERRSLLVSSGLNPRKAAREAAIRRSEAIVAALVDEPLDDPDVSTLARQRAVIGMLDAVFPLATVSAEIELPTDAEGVEALSWSQMQRLAGQLYPELEAGAQGE